MSGAKSTRRVRVIGCGNLLRGDDGVGIVVARSLRRRLCSGNPDVRWPGLRLEIVEAGRPGVALIDLLMATDVALLVDAVATGASPGTIHRLDGRALAAAVAAAHGRRCLVAISSHDAGLAETLALAQTLFPERLPRTVVIWGVEVEQVRFGEGLNPRVAAAVPCLVARICADLHALARQE